MAVKIAVFLLLVSVSLLFGRVFSASVTYDGRALIIDGKRRVWQSGSVNYPRTTPEVSPDIIRKSKEGELDVIESYVFWNYHEPVKGENEMKTFLTKIVSMMKEEKLFASQGGPIILAQVKNEYGNVEGAYGVGGELYVKWAAETAVNLNIDVPWVMCAQKDAPDPVINTCNGAYCDGFTPNSKSKPTMWTENYPGWFLAFGLPIPYRPVEDIAFAVARFFEKGGTFQNYYMYFGGTNFGRTAGGPLVATSYDNDAPIDEYGFIRQPKWGHLRDLHKAIKMCEVYLVSSDPTNLQLGMNLEAHICYKKSTECAAFLANYDSNVDANV